MLGLTETQFGFLIIGFILVFAVVAIKKSGK